MVISNFLNKVWRVFLWTIAIVCALVLMVSFYNSLKIPVLDRDWSEDAKILPHIENATGTISVKNIRDWRYKRGEVISKNYYDETFELSKLEKAYFLVNPFGKWEGVGHAFFVFEFSDGKEISVSIEARREESETYNAIKGIFNEFELWYTFGSSFDLMSRRAVYHNEDLYVYPLLISKESATALFVDMTEVAKLLETQPMFYNTFTSNCTNLLADSANRIKKGSIPFHYSRLFTGYADNQLYDLGFIPNDKSFVEIFEAARVDDFIREQYGENQDSNREEFWSRVKKSIDL